MDGAEKRLGDLIDDYCPRCRRLLDHAVASMVGPQVAKVICQTCYTEHPFRHGDSGKRKADPRTLFDQVLGKASTGVEAEKGSEVSAKPPAKTRAPSRVKSPAVRQKT